MNKIKSKLRSEKGASLTFALLLFLVCAVLCGVVLAAATTASGRMAGIAGTDQRYYAVTSASELLKDLIEEKPVSVVEKTTKNDEGQNVTVTLIFAKPAYEVTDEDTGTAYENLPKPNTILEAAATTYWNTDWKSLPAVNGEKPRQSVWTNGSINVPFSINIKTEANIDSSGTLRIWVYNDANQGKRFTQELVFSGTVTEGADGTGMNTEENKNVRAASFIWTLTGINTL